MKHTGPLLKPPFVTPGNVLKSTSPERGLSHLLTVLEWLDECDYYVSEDGWARFDADLAPLLVGDIVSDLLAYVHEAGELPAMRRAVKEAIEQIATDLELEADNDAGLALQELALSTTGVQ
ncbi:hypothetical protein ABTY63_29940 [Streptomyces solisilvae]|uniref:hypothetical protein n=1 Tax=Streptomyces malaysiensis TaxID=92644 RepID=UPI003318F1C7